MDLRVGRRLARTIRRAMSWMGPQRMQLTLGVAPKCSFTRWTVGHGGDLRFAIACEEASEGRPDRAASPWTTDVGWKLSLTQLVFDRLGAPMESDYGFPAGSKTCAWHQTPLFQGQRQASVSDSQKPTCASRAPAPRIDVTAPRETEIPQTPTRRKWASLL